MDEFKKAANDALGKLNEWLLLWTFDDRIHYRATNSTMLTIVITM